MHVKVYLPPHLNRDHSDKNGYIQFKEDATLREIFRLLKVPFPAVAVHFCRANYEKADLDIRFKEGDIVSFFSFISRE